MADEKDERLASKRQLSHNSLWNVIELMSDVEKSVIYLDNTMNAKKLLNYLVRFFEVLEKFCEVYFQCNYPNTVNRFAEDPFTEIANVSDYIIKLSKFIKVRVSVLLRHDEKSHDIIKKICFKAIARVHRYIVGINFYNKEMFRRSVLNESY